MAFFWTLAWRDSPVAERADRGPGVDCTDSFLVYQVGPRHSLAHLAAILCH